MSLVTSVSGLEGLDIQSGRTARTEKAEEGFQTVLKNKASGTESMDAIFEEAASTYNVSVNLIKAVAKAESGFNPSAVSKSGAIGVMQLMPSTARSLGVTDPYDARQNIMGGTKYLRQNLDRFNGNVSLALAAYNAGPNAVQKYGGIPPYQETQNYVKIVTSYMGGAPIYSGKMVTTGGSSGTAGLGSLGSLAAYSSAAGLYGSSSSSVGSMLGGSSLSGSSSASGMAGLSSYNQLSSLYGLSGQGGYGMTGSSADTLGMLLGSATVDGDGDTISLSKANFVSLIEILRLQMMMNASREVGNITI
ncbi:MAG: lytic transglycosylase domain-containing protein [Lachnospiraceae bacterium]|nr:lytic transglycosylase domain-containing protein [Lachnospiraceae bacterium]